jgi:hypothetical protein
MHSLSSGLPLNGISRSQPPGPPGGRGSQHDAHLVTAERAGGESMATATLASALSDRALADVVAGCAAAPRRKVGSRRDHAPRETEERTDRPPVHPARRALGRQTRCRPWAVSC